MQLSRVLLRGVAFSLLTCAAVAAAKADCPSANSVERYAESSRDALVALSGALPADQYLSLENRYAATIVMEWSLIGVDAIQDDDAALSKLTACFRDQICGADGSDAIDRQLTDLIQSGDLDTPAVAEALTNAPSDSMLEWAEIELGCRPAPEPELEPEAEAQVEPDLISDTDAPQDDVGELQISENAIEPQQDEDTDELASISDDDDSDEVTALAVQITPLPTSTGDPRDLVQTAAAFIASGDVERAIPPLRDACFFEVAETQSSIACETLLDVYEARTLYGNEEV
ncbi:MAG: hypothetical protein AAFQ15_15700, partial [Pseudomonadota bacterium]